MQLIFVRHAQPRWEVDGRNVDNPELTELGRAQADAVAARLSRRAPINHLFVSPTTRTRQTADPVAGTLGLDPTIVDDLREIEGPELEGWPIEKVDALFRTARHRSVEQWWDEGIFNGEGELYRDFHDRVANAIEGVMTQLGVRRVDRHLWTFDEDPGKVVIVGHGGTNGTAIGHLLEAEPAPWSWERFMSFHASITRIEAIPLAGAHVLGLRSFNELDHLGDIDRTR